MSTDLVGVGTTADDGTGDTLRAGFVAVNTMLQKADGSSAGKVQIYEITGSGTNKLIITAAAMASDRTVTGPSDGNLDLESVRLLDAQWIDGVTTTPDVLRVKEAPDSGSSYTAITGAAAQSANRVLNLNSGGDLDLEVVRTKAALITEATAGTGTLIDLFEPTGGGTSKVTLQAPALGGNIVVTLPTAALDLSNVVGIVPTAASAGTGASIGLAEPTGGGASVMTFVAPALGGNITVTGPTSALDMSALIAENTDGRARIPLLNGLGEAGTWTKAISGDGLISITRTAAGSAQEFWVEVPHPSRTSSGKGVKPTGMVVNYAVTVEDADDVRFELWKCTQGAHGAAPTAAVLGGQSDAHYDANHDTAVKRGTVAQRTATVTLPTPAYLAAGESMILRCYVDDTTGGGSVVILKLAELLYSELVVDAA